MKVDLLMQSMRWLLNIKTNICYNIHKETFFIIYLFNILFFYLYFTQHITYSNYHIYNIVVFYFLFILMCIQLSKHFSLLSTGGHAQM